MLSIPGALKWGEAVFFWSSSGRVALLLDFHGCFTHSCFALLPLMLMVTSLHTGNEEPLMQTGLGIRTSLVNSVTVNAVGTPTQPGHLLGFRDPHWRNENQMTFHRRGFGCASSVEDVLFCLFSHTTHVQNVLCPRWFDCHTPIAICVKTLPPSIFTLKQFIFFFQ